MRFQIDRRGLLLVLSAPSGGGKSAALHELRKRNPDLGYSISYTSRAPRGNEVEGRDYFFVSREKFEQMAAANEFYEHAEVHGNLYGTSAKQIQDAMDRHQDIAMDIDVQGGLNIKRAAPDVVLVFLMPPSMEVLEKRLRGRASDAEDQVRLRMENAQREIEHWNQYDYVVVNEDLERTIVAVEKILHAERNRASRISIQRIER